MSTFNVNKEQESAYVLMGRKSCRNCHGTGLIDWMNPDMDENGFHGFTEGECNICEGRGWVPLTEVVNDY